MHLVRLVYFSRPVQPMPLVELAALLEKARHNNAEVGITGKLCASGRWFLQCLEGGRTAVNGIYQKILADDRHTYVTLLDYSHVDRRCFAGWDMAYAGTREASVETVQRYQAESELDPRQLTPGAALALLEELPSLALPGQSERAA